jgi:hypothetical protein
MHDLWLVGCLEKYGYQSHHAQVSRRIILCTIGVHVLLSTIYYQTLLLSSLVVARPKAGLTVEMMAQLIEQLTCMYSVQVAFSGCLRPNGELLGRKM